MAQNSKNVDSDAKSQITAQLAAEWVHIDDIDPWEKNPHKDIDEEAPKIAKLIVKYGFGTPLLGWLNPKTGRKMILAGHTRKKAVQILQRRLGLLTAKQKAKWHEDAIRTAKTGMLPVRVRTDLTEKDAKALALADNKSHEWFKWDNDLLIEELAEFGSDEIGDMGFDASKLEKLTEDTYGIGTIEDGGAELDSSFKVVITVNSEAEQVEVLEYAQEHDWKCRALI